MPGLGARAGEWSIGYGNPCDSAMSSGASSCGTVDISLPPAQRCPDAYAGPQTRSSTDPRCRPGAAPSGSYRSLVAGDAATLRAFTGSSDPAAARALAEGKIVVTDPRFLDHGMATLAVSVQSLDTSGPPREHDVRLPGYAVKVPVPGVQAVMPPATARAAGFSLRQIGVLWTPDHVPSSAQQQRAKAQLGQVTDNAQLQVERGFEARHSALVLGLLAAATVVAVAASGIATGLAAADSQADLATLAAVGARPGLRRRLSGFQCAVIAAMGALLGVGAGIVPAAAVWKNRFAGGSEDIVPSAGGLPAAHPATPLVLPWGTMALLVIGLPLLAWALAALTTRSRVLLVRRAG
jgi:putative ABC transport system permease protein